MYFRCESCDYATACKDRLIAHVSVKHNDGKHTPKRYQCDYCDFNTAYQSSLIGHEYTKHLYELPPEKAKRARARIARLVSALSNKIFSL